MLEHLHQSERDKTAGGMKTFQFSKYITFSIIMMLLKSRNQLLRFHRSSYDSSTRLFFFFKRAGTFATHKIFCARPHTPIFRHVSLPAPKKGKRRIPSEDCKSEQTHCRGTQRQFSGKYLFGRRFEI